MKARWADPETRARFLAALAEGEQNHEGVREYWSHPESKVKASNRMKKLWANPEWVSNWKKHQNSKKATPEERAIHSALMKRLWANPEFRKKQSLSRKPVNPEEASKRSREMWENIEFRKKQEETRLRSRIKAWESGEWTPYLKKRYGEVPDFAKQPLVDYV